MRKHWSNLVLTLLSLVFSTGIAAQSLWGKTSFGMSPQQVRSVVPGAVESGEGSSTLGSGAKERLRLNKVDLVGETFHASFYFLGNKLSQVMLSLENPPPFRQALGTYEWLIEALRSKYGRELSSEASPGKTSSMMSTTWLNGRANITVFLGGIADNPSNLNVIYQVRISKDADKL